MGMRARWMGFGMGIVFVACGGGSGGPTHVASSGQTPAAAAAVAARAVCTRDARCGHVSVSCIGGGAAGGSGSDAGAPTVSCVGMIKPIAYADCYADASGDIAELLTCAAPTAEQIDMLEMCFDMLARAPASRRRRPTRWRVGARRATRRRPKSSRRRARSWRSPRPAARRMRGPTVLLAMGVASVVLPSPSPPPRRAAG